VLDELFTYDGPLGARVGDTSVNVTLWAPTAQQVANAAGPLCCVLHLMCTG